MTDAKTTWPSYSSNAAGDSPSYGLMSHRVVPLPIKSNRPGYYTDGGLATAPKPAASAHATVLWLRRSPHPHRKTPSDLFDRSLHSIINWAKIVATTAPAENGLARPPSPLVGSQGQVNHDCAVQLVRRTVRGLRFWLGLKVCLQSGAVLGPSIMGSSALGSASW